MDLHNTTRVVQLMTYYNLVSEAERNQSMSGHGETNLREIKGRSMEITPTIGLDGNPERGTVGVDEYYGLDLSPAMRAFDSQMANTRCSPLTFTLEVPNDENLSAIIDDERFYASGGPSRFASGRKLVEMACV